MKIWGMSAAERLRRALTRAGVAKIRPSEFAAELAAEPGDILVARGDWVFDEALIRALANRPGVVLMAGAEAVAANAPPADAPAIAEAMGAGQPLPASVLARLTPLGAADLSPSYDSALRRRTEPLLERLTEDSRPQIERRTFAGSYKGVTDIVTRYVWPTPARIVTRWCATAGFTPNMVTLVGFVLVLIAFAEFWRGEFLGGLVAAWLMTFLDTVDGKLARVTLTSSKIGGAFDHAIDLIHPPFWWWAWIVGAGMDHGQPFSLTRTLAVVVGGYILLRVQEGIFLGLFGIEIHTWKPFDSFFRLITSRRNPNLILLSLGLLAGAPVLAMQAVAAWTVVSLVVHTVRILQAMAAARTGPIIPWMTAGSAADAVSR